MKQLLIKDLADLVVADVPEAEARIQRMFEWQFDRSMKICQWVFGFTASLSIAVAVAFFNSELDMTWWQVGAVVLFALGTAIYGILRLWELRFVHRQFVAALKLYSELKEIRPFIVRYRGREWEEEA